MATPTQPVFTGQLLSNGIVAGNQTISLSHRTGGSSKIIYEGTVTRVYQEYLYLYSLGYDVEMTGGKAVWTLTATLNRDVVNNPNTDPIPEDTWELHATAGQQNLLECTDLPTISLLTTPGKEAIESQLKNPLNMAISKYQGPNQAAVVSVYNLMRLGVEARPTFFPTLKRTITVSNTYSANWSLANVGKVLQTSTLIQTYRITPDVSPLLPQSTGAKTDINGVTTYSGWLEYYPTISKGANNKRQISQEWQFNTNWAQIVFPNLI